MTSSPRRSARRGSRPRPSPRPPPRPRARLPESCADAPVPRRERRRRAACAVDRRRPPAVDDRHAGRAGGWRPADGVVAAAARLGGEAGEELVGELLRRRIDQPRAELRELAADLRVDGVGQERVRAVLGEMHVGAALGEAGDAALAFAGDRVALGRIDVGERHRAVEGRLDRADLGRDARGKAFRRAAFERSRSRECTRAGRPGRSASPRPARAAPGSGIRPSTPSRSPPRRDCARRARPPTTGFAEASSRRGRAVGAPDASRLEAPPCRLPARRSPPRRSDRRRARRRARRDGGLRAPTSRSSGRPTIRRSARPTGWPRRRSLARLSAAMPDIPIVAEEACRRGRRPGDRPTLPARRSARRHEGVHQPQRRVHGQYRADRGRRAGRWAWCSRRRSASPMRAAAAGAWKGTTRRRRCERVADWAPIRARPRRRRAGRGRQPLAFERRRPRRRSRAPNAATAARSARR